MTLNEAIEHANEVAAEQSEIATELLLSGTDASKCIKCKREHEQLAEWLEELKSYRASVFSGEMTQKMLKEEYNKAVDDFAKLLRETRDDRTLRVNCDDLEIRHMAERLKGGDGE